MKTLMFVVVAMSTAFLLMHQMLWPFPASVLVYTDRSSQYRDAPFSREEAVGISVLTALQAAQGYPDGTFHPDYTLNRAEFLKIVLKSSPRAGEVPSRPARCFPDVEREDWFSSFVCFGQKQGIIVGYPDGFFRPENPVKEAEALKMLVKIYGYPLTVTVQDEWFSSSVRAAKEHGVFLFPALPLDTSLTRGQMARLAAAFRAEHEGELAEYLAQEQGKAVPPVASSPASKEDAAMSIASSSTAAVLPSVRSHFLLLGSVSEPIADAVFRNDRGKAFLRKINLRLDRTVKSLRNIRVLDAHGDAIATLSIDTNDTEERKNWLVAFSGSGMRIPLGGTLHLQFPVELFGRGSGGVSGELVHIDRIVAIVQSVNGESSWELLPTEKHTPYHQTVQGRITTIRNTLGGEGALKEGGEQVMGAFSVSGEPLPETSLRLEEFQFTIEAHSVAASKWKLRRGGIGTIECFSTYQNDRLISCPIIEESMGSLTGGPVLFEVLADVRFVNAREQTLRVVLDAPGGIGENGALRWSDGTGHYNWVDLPGPLATGTQWEVK